MRQDEDSQELRLTPAVTSRGLCQPCSALQEDTTVPGLSPQSSLSSEVVMARPGIALPLKSMMAAGPRDPQGKAAEHSGWALPCQHPCGPFLVATGATLPGRDDWALPEV